MYRVWIHTFNGTLTVLNLVLIGVSVRIFGQDPILLFFPEGPYSEPSFIWLFMSVSLQTLILITGSIAVVVANSWTIYLYWIATGVLLIADAATGLYWVDRFHDIFVSLNSNLANTLRLAWVDDNLSLANSWNFVQADFHCCGAVNYTDYRQLFKTNTTDPYYLPNTCCETNGTYSKELKLGECQSDSEKLFKIGCSYIALKWLHHQADKLFILGYCVIFLLKSIFVIILRKELGELMKEIRHARASRHNLVGTTNQSPKNNANPRLMKHPVLNSFGSLSELKSEFPMVHIKKYERRQTS